jgi:hypothetical protein
VTAARYEAAGMHHVEASRCGLPVLFMKTGALPEYCADRGLAFDPADFEERLVELRTRYPELREAALRYRRTATDMAGEYEALFRTLVAARRARPVPEPGPLRALGLRGAAGLRRATRRAGALARKGLRAFRPR